MTLRAVLAGCGDASAFWLPALAQSPLVELAAVVDLDRSRAEAAVAAHRLDCAVADDIADAIESSGAAVLLDLAPPARRLENARVAFELGCDVIGEKPMGATLADAVAIASEAARSGRRFATMQNHRFHPGMRALRAAVASGDLGRLALGGSGARAGQTPHPRRPCSPRPISRAGWSCHIAERGRRPEVTPRGSGTGRSTAARRRRCGTARGRHGS